MGKKKGKKKTTISSEGQTADGSNALKPEESIEDLTNQEAEKADENSKINPPNQGLQESSSELLGNTGDNVPEKNREIVLEADEESEKEVNVSNGAQISTEVSEETGSENALQLSDSLKNVNERDWNATVNPEHQQTKDLDDVAGSAAVPESKEQASESGEGSDDSKKEVSKSMEEVNESKILTRPITNTDQVEGLNETIEQPVPTTPEHQAVEKSIEILKNRTSKIREAIEGYSSPPLPPRDRLAVDNVTKTPLALDSGSHAASQSPISPPLPSRQPKKHAVPPPLHEELQSEEFRRNMAMTCEPTPPPMPPRINKAKRLDSAADINLIVNRFRQTSHHYQRQDDQSREDLNKGKDILKTSYSVFLESLPATPKSSKQAKPTEDDIKGEETLDLDEGEKALIEVDWAYWTQVVNDFPSVASDPEKLEKKITDGIPPQIRGIIWQLIANSKSKEFEDIYNTLLGTESPHEPNIRRDLKRTKFIPEDKAESLFNVVKVYSVYDPDVGYTQGMAFIVTPLMLNCESEADAFGLLIRLMKSYGLRELFLPDMPGLMLLLYQFDRLFEENSPQLYNHLTRQGVRSSMYATQWFLTFFAYKFPLGFVLRIYDIVFAEGIESILRIAVNLMLKNSDTLLTLNFDKLLDFLKNELFAYYLKDSMRVRNLKKTSDHEEVESDSTSILKRDLNTGMKAEHDTEGKPVEINDEDYDVDSFVHDAMNDVHVTPITLKRYAAEYEEIHQIEQQKEAQYESIRIKNHQLQVEVRKLERDYTLLNREHVEIANELIKNRLKIETLLDENNDQKVTILNLRKQLEEEVRKQQLPNPDSSIPSDLRQDLDMTIRRNAEVMSANLKLQDKINEQEKVIESLRNGNSTNVSTPGAFKPPLANAFSKLFKNDNN